MSSPPALSLCALLACVIFCLTLTCSGHIPQTLCAARDALPGECRYGMYEDVCGKTVCLKGPAERCGGPFGVMGKCAGGLRCRCERCEGCVVPHISHLFNVNRVEKPACYSLTDDDQGPGASCGQGMRNVYEGICSPGLTCTCDKCTGCSSITMECDKLDEFLCVVEKRITSQLS